MRPTRLVGEALRGRVRPTRCWGKAPVKEQVTLRLSREVLAHFRATGRGWQRRIDEALKDIVASPR